MPNKYSDQSAKKEAENVWKYFAANGALIWLSAAGSFSMTWLVGSQIISFEWIFRYGVSEDYLLDNYVNAALVGGFWTAEIGIFLGVCGGVAFGSLFLGVTSMFGILTVLLAWLKYDQFIDPLWSAHVWAQVSLSFIAMLISTILPGQTVNSLIKSSFSDMLNERKDKIPSLTLLFLPQLVYFTSSRRSLDTSLISYSVDIIFILLAIVISSSAIWHWKNIIALLIDFLERVRPYIQAAFRSFSGFFILIFLTTTLYAGIYKLLAGYDFIDVSKNEHNNIFDFFYDSFRIMSLFNDPFFEATSTVSVIVVMSQITLGLAYLVLLLAVLLRSLESVFQGLDPSMPAVTNRLPSGAAPTADTHRS